MGVDLWHPSKFDRLELDKFIINAKCLVLYPKDNNSNSQEILLEKMLQVLNLSFNEIFIARLNINDNFDNYKLIKNIKNFRPLSILYFSCDSEKDNIIINKLKNDLELNICVIWHPKVLEENADYKKEAYQSLLRLKKEIDI